MRKNRNSFFTESNTSFTQGMMMPPTMPYQAGSSYNSYYAGPNMGIVNTQPDFETRLAKMERQINRLEYRISKLEGSVNNTYVENFDNTDNMYML